MTLRRQRLQRPPLGARMYGHGHGYGDRLGSVKRDIVIFGSGGGARDVHAIVRDLADDGAGWNMCGFLDGAAERRGDTVHALPVLGDVSWLSTRGDVHVVIGVGNPRSRRAIAESLVAAGHTRFATLVHPTVWRGKDVALGAGTVLSAGCLLSTDIRVGDHALVNLACSLTHDDVVDDYAVLAPGVRLSGNVHVGEGADLGTGCVVRQKIDVGAWAIVGAGAVVIRDVPRETRVMGVPAREK